MLNTGSVKCWGRIAAVPHADDADTDSSNAIGDTAAEISALPALTFGVASSGTGSRVKSIVAGSASAAILDDGSLRLWGSGDQLGQPDQGSQVGLNIIGFATLPVVKMGDKKTKSIALSWRHACAILDGGVLKCWGYGPYGQLGLGATLSTNTTPEEVPSVVLGGGAYGAASCYQRLPFLRHPQRWHREVLGFRSKWPTRGRADRR